MLTLNQRGENRVVPGIGPRQLWSLWDMQRFYAEIFFEICREAGRIHNASQADPQMMMDTIIRGSNKTIIERRAGDFGELGLHMCRLHAERLAQELGEDMLFLDFGRRLDELYVRMADECKSKYVFALNSEEAACYEPADPLFGSDVATKFAASAAYEIDEAAKCIALARSTAAVFHLMRVMEVAIRTIGKCLNIPDPVTGSDRNWGKILERVKTETTRRSTARPSLWSHAGDREFFEDVYASLDAVRVAWRNTTMHAENKYSDEEAKHVFGAVRGLMRKIASRMDENGEPKA